MIARMWSGKVHSEKAEEYFSYLQQTGLAEYRATPGNRGVWVLQRTRGEATEFLLISLWESLDAIRAFAGNELERAVYYPEDEAFLLELTPNVDHYELLAAFTADTSHADTD